jgi:ferredoxin
MASIYIDGKGFEIKTGETVLSCARRNGIYIPTLCYYNHAGSGTSCMMCVVSIEGYMSLMPACETPAINGMKVSSNSEEVLHARKCSLELLLSEHRGDCLAPCERSCPLDGAIPDMLRCIQKDDDISALQVIQKNIPVPELTCFLCTAPCERGCRKKLVAASSDAEERKPVKGKPVAIRDVIYELCKSNSEDNYLYENLQGSITIIGQGAAGLYANLFAQRLYSDITYIEVSREVPFNKMFGDFSKKASSYITETLGDIYSSIHVDKKIELLSEDLYKELYQSNKNIFYSVYDDEVINNNNISGYVFKSITEKPFIKQLQVLYENINNITGEGESSAVAFDSHFGKVSDEALLIMNNNRTGLSSAQGNHSEKKQKAMECLECDCRKADTCLLREYAVKENGKQNAYRGERLPYNKKIYNSVIYEQGKCIKCGICVRLAEAHGVSIAPGFTGRGYSTLVSFPFEKEPEADFFTISDECIRACPTGALSDV